LGGGRKRRSQRLKIADKAKAKEDMGQRDDPIAMSSFIRSRETLERQITSEKRGVLRSMGWFSASSHRVVVANIDALSIDNK
jgi:hypothetical protein